ncbi:hypothetical protein BKA62DRAFT_586645, partial [Auriculariales sp. MPI-PUGE-AT-0066]
SSTTTTPRPQPKRNVSFPTSRPLRPFASIANTTFKPEPSLSKTGPGANTAQSFSTPAKPKPKNAVKLIEPPKNMPVFTLNLTQAEFSRRD